MKRITFLSGFITSLLTIGIITPVNSEVIPDGTTNTLVRFRNNRFVILNGIKKGNNLFHSFSEFSVPTGTSARFNLRNTPNITNIFSRVTGRSISNINGLIDTFNDNNSANIFLMNPNGIVFGENARLNINGSFVGTTANMIKFADGVEFSAGDTSTTPLLTISVPMGLQMGQNPGSIINLSTAGEGLTVEDGRSISLIGGEIEMDAGLVNSHLAPGEIYVKTTTTRKRV